VELCVQSWNLSNLNKGSGATVLHIPIWGKIKKGHPPTANSLILSA